jgi:hypothetical protein
MSQEEPRDVYDICDQILKLIPDTEEELIYQLMQFRETLWNQAPELRKSAIFWKPFGNVLEKNITSFDQDWQKKVLKLYNNQ